MIADLRHALRRLARSPRFVAGALATLVCGNAAALIVFSIAYAPARAIKKMNPAALLLDETR